MVWIDVLQTVARLIAGLMVIGFFAGLLFFDKHWFFDKLFMATGVVAMLIGVVRLLIYAVFGGDY